MKYIVKIPIKTWKEKPKGTFIRVPDNIDFRMKPSYFKVLVWLLYHKDSHYMNEYFIKQGIGMDYRTFRNHLKVLEQQGYISISIETNSTETISVITIRFDTNGYLVPILTNKKKKQEETKQEEKKPEETKQEEVPNAGVPPAQDTANLVVKSIYDGMSQEEIDDLEIPFN